ncbi:unnamed protein product [Dibothriocephalus latus]|uniref:Uncharacterized protein n=1 Tax=Dibothriocephalus latus TaxID=60516 RepID=A0A3P7LSJ6_DIBLA|nr:unnamed protein product [Dibothriocephalus latus]
MLPPIDIGPSPLRLSQPPTNAVVPMEAESSSNPTQSFATPVAPSGGGTSAEHVQIRITFSSDWHLPDSEASPAPLVLPLPPDAKYGDLLERIQSYLSSLQPDRVLANGLTTHQTNPFTLPCVTLVVTTDWPRRRLPLDSDHFPKTVSEMNLRGNVGIVVDHALAACPFRMPEPEPEAAAQPEEAAENEPEEEEEEEMDNEPEPAPPAPPPPVIPEEPVTAQPSNPFPQPVEVVPEPTPPEPLLPGLTRTPGRAGNPPFPLLKLHTLYVCCYELIGHCILSGRIHTHLL